MAINLYDLCGEVVLPVSGVVVDDDGGVAAACVDGATARAYPERRHAGKVVGQVAAGQPILAEQNIDSYFPYPADELSSSQANLFMLKKIAKKLKTRICRVSTT